MPRPRPRAAALAGGAVVLFGVGTSVQAGWLLALASCLLGAIVAGLWLPRRMVRGVALERRAPAEAFQGDEVRVSLVAANRSGGVRLALDLVDEHLERTRAFVPALAPGQTVVVETRRTARRRGVHDASGVDVSSAAPFGVARARRTRPVPGATVVFPRIVRLEGLPFLDSVPTPERAIHTSPRRGTGPDYLGIREYRTGDSMRHVHWPSTARHRALMVREFEREQTRRLAVVIDSIADVAGEEPTPLDVCCSIAGSVAFAAHGAGRGVRIVSAAGGEAVSASRTEPGAALRWLAELRGGGGLTVAELCDRLGEEVLGAATVLIATPTWRANDPAALCDAVAELAGRGPLVVVTLVEVHTFQAARRAPHLDAARVDALADGLWSVGALVYRVASDAELAEVLGRAPVGATA
jgi:uncharacterized protein (DUF58 family)